MKIPGFSEEEHVELESFLNKSKAMAARAYGPEGNRYEPSKNVVKDKEFQDLEYQVANRGFGTQFMMLRMLFQRESRGHLPHPVSDRLYKNFGVVGYSHVGHRGQSSAFLAQDREGNLYILRLSLSPNYNKATISQRVNSHRSRAMHTLQGYDFEIGEKMQGQLLPYGPLILEEKEIPAVYFKLLEKLYDGTCFLCEGDKDAMMILPNGAPVFFDPGIIKYEREGDKDADKNPIKKTGFYNLSPEEQEKVIERDLKTIAQKAEKWGLTEAAFPYKNGEYVQDTLLPMGKQKSRLGINLPTNEY